MVYQLHITGDSSDSLDWYYVFGTLKEARQEAKRLSDYEDSRDSGKSVKYISQKNRGVSVGDFDATKYMVITQETQVYFGA